MVVDLPGGHFCFCGYPSDGHGRKTVFERHAHGGLQYHFATLIFVQIAHIPSILCEEAVYQQAGQPFNCYTLQLKREFHRGTTQGGQRLLF